MRALQTLCTSVCLLLTTIACYATAISASVDFGNGKTALPVNGAASSIGYQWKDNTGTNIGARVTAGTYVIAGTAYGASVTEPAGAAFLVWDSGEGTPIYATAPVTVLIATDVNGAVALQTGQNVATLGGLAPPASFNLLHIDASGRMDLGSILGTASTGAAGSVGIDWAQIVNKGSAAILSGTNINAVASSVNLNANESAGLDDLYQMTVGAGAITAFRAGAFANLTIGDPWVTLLSSEVTANSFGTLLKSALTGNVPQTIDAATIKAKTDLIATNAADSAESVIAFTSANNTFTRLGAPILADISHDIQSRFPTASYVAPTNPSDYARNNVAPSWWVLPTTYTLSAQDEGIFTQFFNMLQGSAGTSKFTAAALSLGPSGAGGDPWATLTSSEAAANSFGVLLKNTLDATMSSRMATFTPPSVDGSGRVTLTPGEHTQIQADASTGVLASVIDGGLNLKQAQALEMSVLTGNFTVVRNAGAKTITTTYYRTTNPASTTTTLEILVTNYADAGLTQPTTRTVTYSNLP